MSTSTTTDFSRLVPGYTQVDSFTASDEYEEEEEVVYVTLDLGGDVDSALLPSSKSYRLIGLDTPTPFLQLSGTIFKGRHDELLGTELLFTEDQGASTSISYTSTDMLTRIADAAGDWNKRTMAHVANTERRIVFKQVQLKDKVQPAPPPLFPAPEDYISGQTVFPASGSDQQTNSKPEIELDRLTGKTAPAATRRRREKGEGGEEEGKKRKGKGKARGKGKEKEGQAEKTVDGQEAEREETQDGEKTDGQAETTDGPEEPMEVDAP
ncbi:TFIIIC-sub6 domain-containing protein [Mycena chlorophos]|uniref:TFIIIC-sub6 domain-containing protein n=1 Tax=Mycena chlorophos TaxID=658473 RepID=A0A8H6S5K6_MYCCL|nr:TFIIIC-sub6 domain-containing protein [Mycena chlorophos]